MKISLKGNTTDGETRRVDQPEDRVFLDPVDTLVEVELQPILSSNIFYQNFLQSFSNLSFQKFWNFFANTDTSTRNLFLNLGFVSAFEMSVRSFHGNPPRHPSPT